ncbi:PREDICTED: uncharacterized protein LOC105360006 [Ceratosolen solmsi marchali]|uniref:WW domain binding protein VOPP1 n=1 Tax=Ceratosolen solmsi marchali TaxID=326594 RepID=A0AAJ6VMP1_9HYME|nr:PREDICTED: uncharacterized protein LOC105360006 [Ceratosolen solmsi marchali]
MSRSTKWKFAVVAGISQYLVYAEAKYCAFEIHGEPKYYMCPRTEYCCNFGCCVSPGFQIYHLWYYWLLVIIMFLVCSGGGWWYRYWLQGRYRAAASSIPTRPSNSRTQNSLRGPTCQAQQARITYNTARNTVLLHRMWKGPHRNANSTVYNGASATSSTTHYQNTSVVLNDTNCPYYQLYGPPPSYETVIAQTRNKFSTPSSPELLQSNQNHRSSLPTSSDTSGFAAQCFYNVPSRLPTGLEVPHYGPQRLESFDTTEYVRLASQYGSGQGNEASHFTRGFVYERSSGANAAQSPTDCEREGSTSVNTNLANSPDDGGFLIARMDCLNNSCVLDRSLQCHTSTGNFTGIGVHGISRGEYKQFNAPNSSVSELTSEPVATTSSTFGFERCPSSSQRSSKRPEPRNIQGGSLKITKRRGQQIKYHEAFRANRRLSSVDYESPSTSRQHPDESTRIDSQFNPSSNVIFAINPDVDSTDQRHGYRHQYNQQQQRSFALLNAEQSSTNSNFESKPKLDRSRSLD